MVIGGKLFFAFVRVVTLLLVGIQLFSMNACGLASGQDNSNIQAHPPLTNGSPDFAVLPAPTKLQKTASYSDGDRIRSGDEYEQTLPSAFVVPTTGKLLFEPYYNPELDLANNGMAYACYNFSLPGYSDTNEVTYAWDMWPEDYSRFWLGLANWELDRWDWWPCDATQALALDSLAPYFDPAGRLIAVMLAYDTEATQAGESIGALQNICIGSEVRKWIKSVLDDTVQLGELDLGISSQGVVHILYTDTTTGAESIWYYMYPFGQKSLVDNGAADYLDIDDYVFPQFIYHKPELGSRFAIGHLVSDPVMHWEFDIESGTWDDATCCALRGKISMALTYASYINSATGNLYFSRHEALGWQDIIVDGAVSALGRTGIVINPDNRPCISYFSSAGSSLRYAYIPAMSWVTEEVDTGLAISAGSCNRMVMTTAGMPFITYSDATNETIKLAYKDGVDWHNTVVDASAAFGPVSGIALDAMGVPHISYANLETGAVMHAVFSGTGWQVEVVDQLEGHQLGLQNDISITTGGEVTIAYSGYSNGNEQALLCACLPQ